MNQDEEVPTRVTRGALRRRSVDQEATPQKPAGAATGGTPKKSASTTKKVNALNAIQETEGRPSTPTVGRNTRRRMSETSDTPTILPNKLVQYLKEAEIGAEPGRRSRNTSLTEENLNELNAAYEGGSSVMPTRSRTPARLRASNEALASMNSPQPAVRRSTRRNSVTSDDGSVQSLPVTTPKLTSGLRVLKDDTIIEEDASDDRAESVSSEASTRTTRRQSTAAKKSASPSPRRTAESPVSSVKTDATPPRAMKTPRVSLSPLMLPKGSPRSKNVSFCDDSKQDDSHSSFPKTPTSVSKEVVIVVNDLRNSDLKGLSPKVDREVNLPGKSEPTGDQLKSSPKSPKSENLVGDSVPEMKANDESCSIAASPKPGKDTIEQPNSTSKDKMNSSSTVLIDNGTEAIDSSNNVSGIELLESSVVEISDSIMEANTSVKDTSSVANKSTSEGEKLSQSWSQSVRRSATKGIDEFSVRKQEEQERLEEETEKLQKAPLKSPLKPRSPAAKAASADESIDEDNDDELEDEEEAQDKNELLDDEAVEMEGYESGDSLASDLRREMEENEIMDQGEDLGSEDTEENDEQEEDEEDGNDSWIVSSGDEAEQLNEDELLKDTEDEDLQTKNASLKDEKKTKTPKRRRIIEMVDDSDEDTKASDEERKETAKSPKNLSSKRSLTPVGGKENNTPTKKLNLSQINDAVQNKNQDKLANNTPAKNDTSMESSTDEQQVGNGNETMLPATPAHKTPSKDTGAALHSATKSLSNSKHGNGEKEVAAEDDENDTSGNSETMFQDAEDGGETVQKSDDAMEKDVSLSKSPTKSVIASRKSFPAASITTKDVIGRKSLPANGHMQAAIQSETDEGGESSQPDATQNDEVAEAEALVENVEVENAEHDDKTQAEPAPAEFTMDQPADEAPTKPGRKSMPAVPLISAQFYIGASKKRATIGGEDAHVQTSTPKSNQSLSGKDKGKKTPVEKKATTANGGSTVLNPFAQAKNKARLSLDSGAGQQKPEKKDKLRRSLPSQFVEESMDVDEAPMNENVAEEPSKPDDDKDMMDEVEVVENQEPENGKQQSKAPKPKRKALEDYDLANILSRCNEVIREDKERKKEVASAIRKKKEEKKRLRELEKQEELEASKAAAAAAAAAAAGSGGTTNGDDGGLNSSTTGNDSLSQGGEGLKKKKKRKPKVKNYLLEELAETKKERLEQALRHKLEVIERRKQRKKERQLEQQKQLDKENGNATGASGGIGAKLEKIKKKQKAKSNQESSDKSKSPPVRVALSAFAVFNQLQNHPEQVQSLADKTQKSEKSELMAPAVEKKQHKKSPKKEEASDPQPEAKEAAKTDKVAVADEKAKQANALKDSEQTKKKKRTERQLDGSDPSFSDGKISSTDVVVAASTKKATPAVQTQSESSVVKSDSKINPLLSKSASDGLVQEVEKLTKKQKRKLAAMETTPTNPQKDVTPEGVPAKEMKASSFEEAQTNSVGSKRKEKMRNQTMVESDTVPKQKKSKKQSTQNGHAEDHSSNLAGAKSAFAMHENHTDGQEVVEKKKKKAKKHHAVQPEIDTDQDHSTVEQSRKKTAILERESTTTASAVPTKKRKREQTDSPAATVASTPRPAKHTKLRVLQRIESGGFFEENVTPDKIRLKRNFGFQEQQATPAKQLGFRVSSLLPTDQNELRAVASSSKTHSKDGRMKSKLGGSVLSGPPSRSLPLPVWTSSGVFIESSVDDSNGNTDGKQRKQQQGSNHKTDSGYIQLKGQGKADFRLKTLRPGPAAEKPHRVDPSTTEQSVLNFKRKQLLEKTAHLREKKSNRV